MMKKILSLLFLVLYSIIGFGQNENILYIVDNVPVIDEPEEGFGVLTENEIDRVEVVKDKEKLKAFDYKNLDGVIYVFTKEYVNRADSIKAVPTTKLMIRKSGAWHLKDQSLPYSGRFIDYYLNGKKQGEGFLLNGKLKGERKLYYMNGRLSDLMHYQNGIPHGWEERYYKDGTLMQKGEFQNGKETGIWEMYHPNGQLKQKTNFVNGKMDGESVSYYSTGKLKGQNIYKDKVYQPNKTDEQLFKLYNESQNLYKQGDYKQAIKKLDKALSINDNWDDAYFARGTMKLNDFRFDEAIVDFNKTLEIEPFYINAYANRAFALIRKYEFTNGRTLSNSDEFKVMSIKGNEIPASELIKICTDLNKAVELGDENPQVLEAVEKHCKK